MLTNNDISILSSHGEDDFGFKERKEYLKSKGYDLKKRYLVFTHSDDTILGVFDNKPTDDDIINTLLYREAFDMFDDKVSIIIANKDWYVSEYTSLEEIKNS